MKHFIYKSTIIYKYDADIDYIQDNAHKHYEHIYLPTGLRLII